MVTAVINLFAFLALLGNIALGCVLLLYLGKLFFRNKLFDRLKKAVTPYSYHLALLLSLTATLASLFLSEIAKLPPCVLCWYQRILMYPQPVLLYLALLRNERILTPYLLLINGIGAVISLYHYSLHILPKSFIVNCDPSLGGVSCVKGYNFYLGFMTFPYMAFTVFVLIIVLLLFSNSSKGKSQNSKVQIKSKKF